MSRHYSDSDDGYSPNNRQGSGWRSPVPRSTTNHSSSSYSMATTRIVVESPFGSDKCDYSIDKNQPGRLVVTARRPRSRSTQGKNHVAVQTFTIPSDADVDRLQSHVERNSNRLIIEIPRQQRNNSRSNRSSYPMSMTRNLIRSPDVERMLTSPTGGPQLVREKRSVGQRNSGSGRKLEYRIDCHGYHADELEVFIQGRDLMVQGKTRTSSSGADPTQQRVSKKFTRKISLPNTVDLPGVVSYLEHGELRIEAPLKRGVYYSDEEIIIPGPPPPSTSARATSALITNFDRRIRSPVPSSTSNSHYRRNERSATRRRDYDRRPSSPNRRVRSADRLRYPLYVPPREFEEDDEDEDGTPKTRYRQNGHTDRHFSRRKDTETKSSYRSVYSPTPRERKEEPSDENENYLRF